jgi:hypothetical protein
VKSFWLEKTGARLGANIGLVLVQLELKTVVLFQQVVGCFAVANTMDDLKTPKCRCRKIQTSTELSANCTTGEYQGFERRCLHSCFLPFQTWVSLIAKTEKVHKCQPRAN